MLQLSGQISPLGGIATGPTPAALRSRRFQTARLLILLAAPAVLLIALTVQGWDQVLQTESTVLRVHRVVQRSLRVAALITELQVERGRSAMLLSMKDSLDAGPRMQLLVERRKVDSSTKYIQDWSYINIQGLNTTNVKQRPQYFSIYLTRMRALIDKGAANMSFTLDAYTLLIKDLMSSLLGGLQLCIAVRYMATGASYYTIADAHKTSTAAVSRVVEDVTDYFYDTCNRYVRWPYRLEDKMRIAQGFYDNHDQHSMIMGVIDGTHISIISPTKPREAVFINRKGYYSINAMDEEQHIYLPAFHTFMMAGDNVGLIRAWGSAIWVSCEDGQAARVSIIRELAQYVALIRVGVLQSQPLKAAFDKIGLDVEDMVQELEDAVAYLITDSFKTDCETTSAAGRLKAGEQWFHNMTGYIHRISLVREAFIVALQKIIDDLMSSIKTMALVYSFIIVLTIFCTIGSTFTAINSIRTSWKLHELSRLLTEKRIEVETERSRCNEMLNQMLPLSIAEQLTNKGRVEPEYFEDVTVFISSIAEFEGFSNGSKPAQVIGFLNSLQEVFDEALKRYDVCGIDTVGHTYMLVSGLPIRNGDVHARNIARLALYIKQETHEWSMQLRMGIHSGPCMAGIIGNTTPRYCVIGDAVNTASKIEASGEGTKILLSESTHDSLDRAGGFVISPNTDSNLQEKLKVKTYWLEDCKTPSTGNRSEVFLSPEKHNSAWQKN